MHTVAPTLPDEVRARLEAYYSRRGLRRTPQRESIIAAAFAGDEHFTPEELLDRVRRVDARTSRATVYRTIALLIDAGLLREVDLGQGQTCYDPNFIDRPDHNHLVCIDCGRVLEFEDSHLGTLVECLSRRLGFHATRQNLRIEACCEELRTTGRCAHLIEARLKGKRLPGRRR